MEIEARKIIGEILQNYNNLQDKSDIEGFVKSQLRQYGIYKNEADIDTAAQEICSTIDNIDSSFKDLKGYNKIGQKRSKWLENQLNQVVNKLPESEQAEFIETFNFKDNNKGKVAEDFEESIREFTHLSLADLPDQDETGIISQTDDNLKQPESNSVKDFLKTPLDSPEDLNIKTTVATATVIAKEKGFIKSLETSSNEEIAATVDYGLTGVKVAYKVGSGEMKHIDAIDYMVDKATAVVATLVKSAVEKGVAFVCEVGAAIGISRYFKNPVAIDVARQIGKTVGESAGKAAGEYAAKGVKLLGKGVKGLLKNVGQLKNSIKDKLKQAAKRIAG